MLELLDLDHSQTPELSAKTGETEAPEMTVISNHLTTTVIITLSLTLSISMFTLPHTQQD